MLSIIELSCLFELSKNGTLGKIANETPNGEQLNLKIFREEPFDLVTNQSYPSPSLPKIYLHLKAVSPEWVIDKDIQTLFKQFKDNLLQLGADTIIEESSKILSQRKANKEFGGLYYGFQFTPEDRDDRFYIEVDIKTEELISNIMKAENNIDLDELTTNEKMIIEGLAGTGKTIIAAKIACDPEYDDKKVLILTKTKHHGPGTII